MLSKNYVYQLIIKFNTIDNKATSNSRLITKKQYDSD